MCQDSRAAGGRRFLQFGTPAQEEGNEADQQADERTLPGRSQECTGQSRKKSKQLENSTERAAARTVDHEDQDDHVDLLTT